MVNNRWLIVIGMIVLISMLVVAAFALGVYVGEHGWTRQGLRYQPGGPQPPPKDAPLPGLAPPGQPGVQPQPGDPGAPQGLPPGRPQLTGRVRNLNPGLLDLATPDGPRQVHLVERTRLLDENGAPLPWSDLQRGDIVGVFGRVVERDGGRQFVADVVVILPPK